MQSQQRDLMELSHRSSIFNTINKRAHPILEEEDENKGHQPNDHYKDQSIDDGPCQLCSGGIVSLHNYRTPLMMLKISEWHLS
jgi:hypothetical protein